MGNPGDHDESEAPDSPVPSRRLEIVFEAFHDKQYPCWYGYAYLHTGTRSAARAVCHDLSRCLAASWPAVLGRSPAHYAWTLLKEILAVRLIEGAESVFTETAAFHATLERKPPAQEQFRLMEQALSLYWGISRLPERQRDLLVLFYTLGQDSASIAELMDEEEAVIGVQLDVAAARLSALLGARPRHRRPEPGE